MSPKSNQQIELLEDVQYQMLLPHLQLVSLSEGEHLFRPGGGIEHAYFPVNALIAIANEMTEATSIDMALMGNESSVGLMGVFYETCPYRVHVVGAGFAYKVSLRVLKCLGVVSDWVQKMYMQTMLEILRQTAIEASCVNFHCTKERVARWLLIRTDRLGENVIETTHHTIAECIGVRREGVTNALSKMPGVYTSRSHIEVLDRSVLMQESCECYRAHAQPLSRQMTLPFGVQSSSSWAARTMTVVGAH